MLASVLCNIYQRLELFLYPCYWNVPKISILYWNWRVFYFFKWRYRLRLLINNVIYLTYGSFDISFALRCLLIRSFSVLCFRLYFLHPGNQSAKIRLSFYIVLVNTSMKWILLFYNAHMLINFQMLFHIYLSCFVKMNITETRCNPFSRYFIRHWNYFFLLPLVKFQFCYKAVQMQ